MIQRNFLRRLVGIHFPKKISNKELYKITNTKPWSETCKERRLTLFGHICRLPDGAPAKLTLFECMKPIKRPVGRPKTTLIKNISNDFKSVGENLQRAVNIAKDKDRYRALLRRVMS